MKQDILVTVIIPVYNTAAYIQDCIESVLHQTYSNLEIILINDGSTDDSAEICRQYKSNHRVCFIDRENRGLSKTRQEGIDLAKGKYFCNLDSDDCMDLSFVERMLSKALETDADIVTCGRKDFDGKYEEDFLLSAEQISYPLTKEDVSNKFDILASKLWLADSWNKLYRTEFVRNSGVRYWLNNKYNGTDLSFNHLLLLYTPQYAVVNEPLLLHRIVQGSRVHRKNKPLQEGFEIITDRVFTEADNLGYGDNFKESYSSVYTRYLKMVFMAIVTESESINELIMRHKSYCRSLMNFAKKYPVLSPNKLKDKRCSGFDLVIYKAMLSPSAFMCACAYELNKLREWKNRKR